MAPAVGSVSVRIHCTYCHDGLTPGVAVYCALCLAPHHAGCFLEHGTCAAPGCSEERYVQATTQPASLRRRRGWVVAVCGLGVGLGAVAAWGPWTHPASNRSPAVAEVVSAPPAASAAPVRSPEPDPGQTAAHVVLASLAYGWDRTQLAIQTALWVGSVHAEAGEAFYVAAVAAAGREGNTRRDHVQIMECLQRATDAGFDWSALAEQEPRLEPLRSLPLWSRLGDR